MLVLARKVGEKIAIDGDIVLEVLEVRGNRVRLGITAPDDCRVLRKECLDNGPSDRTPLQTESSGLISGATVGPAGPAEICCTRNVASSTSLSDLVRKRKVAENR